MKKFKLNNKTIILASHNTGKIAEFKTLFSDYNVKIKTISSLGINEIDETGKTFEENAIIKVKTVPNGFVGLSDDSGLCIRSLNHALVFTQQDTQKKMEPLVMEKLYFETKN